MVKLIEMMTRKEGLTHEQFMKHWTEVHAPIVKKIPGLRRYVQNHSIPMKKGVAPYDGIAEVWYDDMDAFRAVLKWYRENPEIQEDEKKFLDMSKLQHFICEEKVFKEK